MTAAPDAARWIAPARRRAAAAGLLVALPLVALGALLGWRFGGIAGAIALVVLLGLGSGLLAWRRLARLDRGWLVRGLDARDAGLEDSAGLLFAPEAELGPLQRLQRARLLARLDAAVAAELRPAWPMPTIAAAWLAALAAGALILLTVPHAQILAPAREGLPTRPGVPALVGQRLRIVPPAYTGLPARDFDTLDAKAPQGSRLEWTLRFAPTPAAAALSFAGAGDLALRPADGDWTAGRTLAASLLYRVQARGAPSRPPPPLHRIDAIPDRPPRIRALVPVKSLTLVTPGQTVWALLFEVSDDYGVAPTARLRVTTATGDGENVTFREHVLTVAGTGGARVKRFAPRIDLATFGFAGPGDLVVQLVAADNRMPGPQVVRGPSLILRRPSADATQGSGLDAMARQVLPAYFASERRIIIDAEALIRARRSLPPPRFLQRSDALGADQQALRMRYGKFMGQEVEGQAKPPPTADAAAKPPVADDDDPPAPAKPPAFGTINDATAEYGHVHDEAEAATLFDPETRATLKGAIENMWQAELQLRQGAPQAALPFANKALVLIKRVQQATRIFLGRVGSEQAPIDFGRRMTGKREGIADRAAPIAPIAAVDPAPAAAWRALEDASTPVPFAALDAWVRGNGARLADPLALAAAIDAARRDPGCAPCRATLRAQLWSALARPAAAVARRPGGDAAGRRYLDAIAR